MEITRREFLKISGLTTAGVLLTKFGFFDLRPAVAYAQDFKLKYAHETTTICNYCGCGCGAIVSVKGAKVINIEGDPDHPINQGALCSKGSALYQVANNEHRLRKVLYRAPGSGHWEERDWDWALEKIASNIKKTRDEYWQDKDEQGNIVNRVEAIANFGGAALDNEECYLLSKVTRALGLINIEHQARI